MSYIGVLNTVREIISKLSSDEKASIRLYLSLFVEKGKVSFSKSIRLFDILVSLKDQVIADEEIELMIYAKPNSKTFSQLAARLRDKLLEGLLLDVNIMREGAYPEKSKAVIEVRKNITQAQILQNRGARKVAESLFEKSIGLAKKYELYEELLLALRFLIKQRSADKGDRQIATLMKQYEKYDDAKNAVLKAEINHRIINAEVDFRSSGKLNPHWLKGMLDEMRTDFKRTSSVQIGYYYFFLEAQYFQQAGNYKNARKSLLNTQRLIELNTSMNTPLNTGTVILNLADNDLYLRQFERSFVSAQAALNYLHKDNFNYAQGLILMFYSRYYAGRFETAKSILTDLLPDSTTVDNFWAGQRIYMLANTCFMLGDFTTALRYLNILNPIEEDKEGWNTGMRILSIMTLIELEQYDEATARTESLRKFLITLSIVNTRLNLIYDLLQSLSNSGFVFKSTYLKEKNKIEELESSNPETAWKIKSPELVIFQQWLSARTFRQKLKLVIPNLRKVEMGEEIKQS